CNACHSREKWPWMSPTAKSRPARLASCRWISAVMAAVCGDNACPVIQESHRSRPMKSPVHTWRLAAGLLGLAGVAIGAVAAHALADPHAATVVERASLYQILHAMALLVIAGQPGRFALAARCAFMVGIALFCGGLYLRYLGGLAPAGVLAPYGGMALMLGWLLAGLARWPRA